MQDGITANNEFSDLPYVATVRYVAVMVPLLISPFHYSFWSLFPLYILRIPWLSISHGIPETMYDWVITHALWTLKYCSIELWNVLEKFFMWQRIHNGLFWEWGSSADILRPLGARLPEVKEVKVVVFLWLSTPLARLYHALTLKSPSSIITKQKKPSWNISLSPL